MTTPRREAPRQITRIGALMVLAVLSVPSLAREPVGSDSSTPDRPDPRSVRASADDRELRHEDGTPRGDEDLVEPEDAGDAFGVEDSEELFVPEGEVFLDLEEVDTSEVSPFSFHGVLDLTYVHFESDRNVDGFDEDQVLALHPMLMFKYTFHERVEAVLEVEWEGIAEEFEVEQAYLQWSPFDALLRLGVGRHALPFGAFRMFHSPARNDLVDEPAVFRAVYPEVFPDLGVFARGEYVAEEFSIGYEVSVSKGLHGPSRQAAWGDITDNNDSGSCAGSSSTRSTTSGTTKSRTMAF